MKIETIDDYNSVTIQSSEDGNVQWTDPGFSFIRKHDGFRVDLFDQRGGYSRFTMTDDTVRHLRDALTKLLRNKGD